jgi:hypothetical protein
VPFTPSHAVVALPFLRTPLVPAAIAVGAMSPDLPLFVRTGLPLYGYTHDLLLVPVTTMAALALLILWRCALRPAAAELSPDWLAARLPAGWAAGARAGLRETFASRDGRVGVTSVVLLTLSLVLGVVSHIVWDLFTHEGRGGVQLLPALAEPWGPVPGYTWVQHGSSVLGLVILAGWAARTLRRARPHPLVRVVPTGVRAVWWISLPVALTLAWGIGLLAYGPLTAQWTAQHLAYRVLPPAAGVWGGATVVLAGVVTWRIARHARDARRFARPAERT